MLTNNGTEQNLAPPSKTTASQQKLPKSAAFFAFSLLFVTIFIAAVFFLYRASHPFFQPVSDRLGKTMSDDLTVLKKRNALPSGFDQLRSIELTTESSTFKPWTDETKIPLKVSPSGQFNLEIFVFFYIDEKKYGANVQYDLVDSKTKNTVWEATRKYELGYIF